MRVPYEFTQFPLWILHSRLNSRARHHAEMLQIKRKQQQQNISIKLAQNFTLVHGVIECLSHAPSGGHHGTLVHKKYEQ